MGLTPRQRQALEFIKRTIAERDVPPTYREIAKHLGTPSLGRVSEIMEGLEERGAITKKPHLWRSITLTDHGSVLPENVEIELRKFCRQSGMSREAAIREAVKAYLGML